LIGRQTEKDAAPFWPRSSACRPLRFDKPPTRSANAITSSAVAERHRWPGQIAQKGTVGDCRQLKTDVDSYNDNQNTGEPIQLVLDFTDDMAEYEALKALA